MSSLPAGDFNGEIARYQTTSNPIKIHMWISAGSAFGNWRSWKESMTVNSFEVWRTTNRVVAGDFNGDGKDDIACMYEYPNSRMKTFVFFSDGTRFNREAVWLERMIEGSFECWRITGRLVAGDFNSDGKADIAGMYEYTQNNMRVLTWLSNGSRFTGEYTWIDSMIPGSYKAPRSTGRFVAGDINGDGKTDIATIHAYPNGMREPHMYISPGVF